MVDQNKPLEARKEVILRAVVIEYIAEGEPIGSELIASKYSLGVRSATVRNELAEMSEMGFLEQPHTSAGRVPSDRGYRYFVDRLLDPTEPERESKKRVIDATKKQVVLQQLLAETTKAVSRIAHQLTAASTVGNRDLRVISVILSAMGPARALLVVVLSNGHVENLPVDCPPGTTLDELGLVNDHMSRASQGKSIGELSQGRGQNSGANNVEKLISLCNQALKTHCKSILKGQVFVEGQEYVLAQPEFQRDNQTLSEVLRILENEDSVSGLMQQQGNGIYSVSIGSENSVEAFRAFSVMRHKVVVGDQELATIAIIGPTRQDYAANQALLTFTARALGETLQKTIG